MYSVDLGLTLLAPVADILFSSRAWQNIFTATKIHFTLSLKIKKEKQTSWMSKMGQVAYWIERNKEENTQTNRRTDFRRNSHKHSPTNGCGPINLFTLFFVNFSFLYFLLYFRYTYVYNNILETYRKYSFDVESVI